ncbi:MAG: hypothetical protein QOI31_2142 [Solirubrobacterales bacterium]|nr:hypothetical protein [Solirubrobacterales bacterium]
MASLLLAQPASALKLKYVQVVNVVEADAVESVEAFCPNGYSVTGGGAFSNGAFNETRMQDSHPVDGPDSDSKPDDGWRASIWNTAASARNSESQAICAKNLATKVKSKSFMPGGIPPQTTCPNGMTVTGGGIETSGTFALPPAIISSRPGDESAGGRVGTWFVNADPAGMSSSQASGYAICVDKSALELNYTAEGFTADNLEQDTGAEVCEPGERVVGLGAATNSNNSALVSIFGIDTTDTDTKLDDGTTATVDNYNASSDIFPEAYSVCVA